MKYPAIPIQDAVRLADVKRWVVVNTTKQQSVAEHSMLVTLLAIEIAKRMGIGGDSPLMHQVMAYAIFHDLDEALSGDIPTTTKKRMPKKVRKRLSPLANGMEVSKRVKLIVKLADLIEGTTFIEQHAEGVHAAQVMSYMNNSLNEFIDGLPMWYMAVAESILTDLRLGQRGM